jgi:hypothetical protein
MKPIGPLMRECRFIEKYRKILETLTGGGNR